MHIPVPFLWVLKNRKQDAERDLLHCSYSVGSYSCAAASQLVYSFSKAWCEVSSLTPLVTYPTFYKSKLNRCFADYILIK